MLIYTLCSIHGRLADTARTNEQGWYLAQRKATAGQRLMGVSAASTRTAISLAMLSRTTLGMLMS